MAFKTPKDWEKDSDELFIHKTGVRVHYTTYKSKESWFLIPVDMKEPVVEFESSEEGRDKAFEHFAEEKKKKKKPKVTRKRKPKAKAKKDEDADTGEAAEDEEE